MTARASTSDPGARLRRSGAGNMRARPADDRAREPAPGTSCPPLSAFCCTINVITISCRGPAGREHPPRGPPDMSAVSATVAHRPAPPQREAMMDLLELLEAEVPDDPEMAPSTLEDWSAVYGATRSVGPAEDVTRRPFHACSPSLTRSALPADLPAPGGGLRPHGAPAEARRPAQGPGRGHGAAPRGPRVDRASERRRGRGERGGRRGMFDRCFPLHRVHATRSLPPVPPR